jgi:hypothetical protein
MASALLRYAACEKSLAQDEASLSLPGFSDDPIPQLLALESSTRTYAQELQQAAGSDGRKALEKERDEISDCLALETLLSKAENEIERLKSEALISVCLGQTSTNLITRLGNDIADEVITPNMRDNFRTKSSVLLHIVFASKLFGQVANTARRFTKCVYLQIQRRYEDSLPPPVRSCLDREVESPTIAVASGRV